MESNALVSVRPSDGRVDMQCMHCHCAIFVRCDLWQADTPYYCDAHANIGGRDPQYVLPDALAAAGESLSRHSDTFVKWSLPSLHGMLGFLMPGTVTYGCALPGNGKTSFLSKQIADWDALGVRPWVMPTESRPKGLMTRLICNRLRISSDDAMSGALRERMDRGDLQAKEDIRALTDAYTTMQDQLAERDATLAIEPAPHLTRTIFRESCKAAAEWGAGIVIVDHVDHIRGDATTGNGYQASEAVQNDALEFAELFDLPVLLMSQLNRSKTDGDPLAVYRPPQVSWIWMPGPKEQNATGIFGLFRPMQLDLDEGTMKAIKANRTPSWKCAIPHCMGVLDMKKRFGGERRDNITYLEYERGQLRDMPPHRLLEIEQAQHRIF